MIINWDFVPCSLLTLSGTGMRGDDRGVQGCLIGANWIKLPESAIYWSAHCALLTVSSCYITVQSRRESRLLAVRQRIAPPLPLAPGYPQISKSNPGSWILDPGYPKISKSSPGSWIQKPTSALVREGCKDLKSKRLPNICWMLKNCDCNTHRDQKHVKMSIRALSISLKT